jgi:hypothetical protein
VTETPLNSIVVESIVVVPEREGIVSAGISHGIGNEQEVLEELHGSAECSLTDHKTLFTLDAMSS